MFNFVRNYKLMMSMDWTNTYWFQTGTSFWYRSLVAYKVDVRVRAAHQYHRSITIPIVHTMALKTITMALSKHSFGFSFVQLEEIETRHQSF